MVINKLLAFLLKKFQGRFSEKELRSSKLSEVARDHLEDKILSSVDRKVLEELIIYEENVTFDQWLESVATA